MATTNNASTLDLIAERLKTIAEGAVDVQRLPVIPHKATGLSFRVGPMQLADYNAWQNLRLMEDKKAELAKVKENGGRIDRARSDLHLLCKAVRSEEGELLPPELAKVLLTGVGCGPSTFTLLAEAERQNPPREHLASEVAIMWVKNQTDLVVWRLLFELGLGKALLDYTAPSATPEEKEWAQAQVAKAQEAVYGLMAYFDVEDAAKNLGITFREAALQVANGKSE